MNEHGVAIPSKWKMVRRPVRLSDAYRVVLMMCVIALVGLLARIRTGRPVSAAHKRSNEYEHANFNPACFRDKHVVLMGDSTMARAAAAFQEMFNCTLVRAGSRCDFSSYYGDAVRNSTHSKQIPPGSGPCGHGLSNRGCMDCSGCHPTQWHCSILNITVELIGIEFARDMEYPTAFGDFTQESIIRGYMARTYDAAPPYAIAFSTGLHDLGVQGTNTKLPIAFYEENVEWLTSLLHDSFRVRGSRLMWISTSAIVPETQDPRYRSDTANDAILEYNKAAERVMRKWLVPAYDVFPLTQKPEIKALCRDGIHYGTPSQFYYRLVALNIAMAFCGRIWQ